MSDWLPQRGCLNPQVRTVFEARGVLSLLELAGTSEEARKVIVDDLMGLYPSHIRPVRTVQRALKAATAVACDIVHGHGAPVYDPPLTRLPREVPPGTTSGFYALAVPDRQAGRLWVEEVGAPRWPRNEHTYRNEALAQCGEAVSMRMLKVQLEMLSRT